MAVTVQEVVPAELNRVGHRRIIIAAGVVHPLFHPRAVFAIGGSLPRFSGAYPGAHHKLPVFVGAEGLARLIDDDALCSVKGGGSCRKEAGYDEGVAEKFWDGHLFSGCLLPGSEVDAGVSARSAGEILPTPGPLMKKVNFNPRALRLLHDVAMGNTPAAMKYSDFQHLARLHAVGSLELEELEALMKGRLLFGRRAEAYLEKCTVLTSALALSLEPIAPSPGAAERLMQEIRQQGTKRETQLPTGDHRAALTEIAIGD